MTTNGFSLEIELAYAERSARLDLSYILTSEQVETEIERMKEHDGRELIRYGVRLGIVSPCYLQKSQ